MALRALAWLALVRVALHVVPFRWLRAWVDGTAPVPTPPPDHAPFAVRRAMQRAARTIPGSTCLARAMVAERLLRSEGFETTLTIGVARGAPGALPLDAHAWVSSRGMVVAGEGELEHYTTLVRYESGP